MQRGLQGRYATTSMGGEEVRAFIPNPLPPSLPIDWTPALRSRFDDALLALGRLDGVSTFLPDASLFLYMYVRKEAVVSSMIEGTQSSLSDLLLFELGQQPTVPVDDVQEVSNYVAALYHGLQLLQDGLPVSLRLFKKVHRVFLSQGRGSNQNPGQFRSRQNWIGGTRPGNALFVPPPKDEVMNCMGALELFLHDQPEQTPPLLKVALAHAQFETIHPFLDGNGRLGRLLITLLLCEYKILSSPILYLSLYFKTHRQYYYDLLTRVRMTGDWETWLEFFAEAVTTTANQAVEAIRQLRTVTDQDRDTIENSRQAVSSTIHIHQILIRYPIATSQSLVNKTGFTPATVNKALHHLEQLGIVQELTNQKRNRVFRYTNYMNIMDQGTELPSP